MTQPNPESGANLTWTAFLVMAFVIVGLTGLFISFAVPLPYERAMSRDEALDAARVAAHGPDPGPALEALRDRLGDSADAILPAGPDFDARIVRERAAMHARLRAEAHEVALRTRWLVCVITVMGAAFGAALLHLGRRA